MSFLDSDSVDDDGADSCKTELSGSSSTNDCLRSSVRVPVDIASSPNESPRQPKIKFPLRSFGKGRQRGFNVMWYKSFPWLEYSVSLDAAFCYPCRLFKCGNGEGRAEEAFTRCGFRNWKNAIGKTGIISRHGICNSHKQSMVSWNDYTTNVRRQSTIEHRIDSAHQQLITENRHYIFTLAEVLLMCAKQNMALRGHRESAESSNRGNFLAIMDLIVNHDSVIKEKLHGQRNAVYTSPQIQNHLLQLMGNAVRQRIIKAVQEATVFAILADESKDVNKIEQLSIAVRYVDIDNASVMSVF